MMQNGLLCKNVDGNVVIVVPKLMQMNIVKKAHDQGHFKFKKLEEIIKKEFYIPHLKSKVDEVVSNCVDCILIEKKSGKLEGKLHPIPKQFISLDTFHMDHVGPMPSTNKNYQHILTTCIHEICLAFSNKVNNNSRNNKQITSCYQHFR